MNSRRTVLSLLAAATMFALAACGGSSGPNLPVAVSFTMAPPSSVGVGGTFQVVAVVSNTGNMNIMWSCAPAGSCGTFNPTSTKSGVATTYTAPPTAPPGGSVTISGTSNADSSKSASANVTITGTTIIAFSSAPPPTTITIGSMAPVTATITGDAAVVSAGVDWTVTCTGATTGCGAFGLVHTASGLPSNYTPPPTVPAGGLAVTVTGTATGDTALTVSGTIFVSATAPGAFLCANCSYTFSAAGTDSSLSPFALAGVLTTDGMGNITGGEQDFSDFTFTTGGTPDAITSGTYTFGSDGRGTITITLNNTSIGVNGVETFGVVLISANHTLINQLDNSATASGSMDMQTSTSAFSGNYALVGGGADLVNALPTGWGAVFSAVAGGTISSSSGVTDANLGGFTSKNQNVKSGSMFTGPDASGRVLITIRPGFIDDLNSNFHLGLNGPIVMAGYINDATHFKFVEVDSNFAITSGLAIGQMGTLTGGGVLPANATFVFTAFGTGVTGPQALAATFTSDGSSNLQSGFSDVNSGGVPTSGNLTGTYSVSSGGTGRVAVTLNGAVGNPGNSGNYAIYLTGGPDPGMVLELDQNAVTTGSLYTQSGGPFTLTSFQGQYGLNFTLFNPSGSIEVDVNGQTLADGAGNLLGALDINNFGAPSTNVPFTGSYAASTSGRFTGSLTSKTTGTLGLSYFVVSPSTVVLIETDAGNAVSLGLIQLQKPPF